MTYQRRMSFQKSTRGGRERAVIDLYFYGDRIDILTQNGMETIRPEGGVTTARIEEVMAVMRAQGYRLMSDVNHSRRHTRPRKAALAR